MDDSGGKTSPDANAEQTGESTPKNVVKPKRRSLVERELETSLTARITSPMSAGETTGNTSRFGRTRKLKTNSQFCDPDNAVMAIFKSPTLAMSPARLPSYKLNASSTLGQDSPKTPIKETSTFNIENQIENIRTKNISLSRFGTGENQDKSPAKKLSKVYTRKDLIQSKEKGETASIMKSMFSPAKSPYKPSTNTHLSNILERSSEKYNLNIPETKYNSCLGTSSVVKTLDFDSGKKKKADETAASNTLSKSDIFETEAKCEYQVGDIAWSRVGTYPFWPCIITRDPFSNLFVKKKLFGRVERDVVHVTFFGDNGRRGWIVDNMLRKFRGLQEFEATKAGFTPQSKKKDPRFYAAFFVSDKKRQSWNISVQEAESLMREPKRLRVDALNNLLSKTRIMRTTPKRQKSEKIVRTDSDVSLSESLYDTLFSEDDTKGDDQDKSKNKSRKKSLDVSEVVTACLDNMAAKTGISKIQKQSHMDRWLQKAKSKTPEKRQSRVGAGKSRKEGKGPSSAKESKNTPTKNQRPFIVKNKFSGNEQDSLGLLRITTAFQLNEHDYTKLDTENDYPANNQNTQDHRVIIKNGIVAEHSCGIGIISKVETLSDCSPCEEKPAQIFDVENNMCVITEELIVTETFDGIVDESTQKDEEEVSESKLDTKDKNSSYKQTDTDKKDLNTPERAENHFQNDVITAHESQILLIAMPSTKETSQTRQSPSFRVSRKSKRLSLDPNIKRSKASAVELLKGIVDGSINHEHNQQQNENLSRSVKTDASIVKEHINMLKCIEKQSQANNQTTVLEEKVIRDQIEVITKCDPKVSNIVTRSIKNVVAKAVIDKSQNSGNHVISGEPLEQIVPESLKVPAEIKDNITNSNQEQNKQNNEDLSGPLKTDISVRKDHIRTLNHGDKKSQTITVSQEMVREDKIECMTKCDTKRSKMITRSNKNFVPKVVIDESPTSGIHVSSGEHHENNVIETLEVPTGNQKNNFTNIDQEHNKQNSEAANSSMNFDQSIIKEHIKMLKHSEKEDCTKIVKEENVKGITNFNPKMCQMVTRSNKNVVAKVAIDKSPNSVTQASNEDHIENDVLESPKTSTKIEENNATNVMEVALDVSKILADFSLTDEDSLLGELGNLSEPNLGVNSHHKDEIVVDKQQNAVEKVINGYEDDLDEASKENLIKSTTDISDVYPACHPVVDTMNMSVGKINGYEDDLDEASKENLIKLTTDISDANPACHPAVDTMNMSVGKSPSKSTNSTDELLTNGHLETETTLFADHIINTTEGKVIRNDQLSEEISGVEEIFEAQLRKAAEKSKLIIESIPSENSRLMENENITDSTNLSVDDKDPESSEEISGVEEIFQAQLKKAAEISEQTKEILLSQSNQVMEKETLVESVDMSNKEGEGALDVKPDVNQVGLDTPAIQKQSAAVEKGFVEEVLNISENEENTRDSEVDVENTSEPESPDFEEIACDEGTSNCEIKTEFARDKVTAEMCTMNICNISKRTRSKSYKYNSKLIPLRDFDVKVMRMPIERFIKRKKVRIIQIHDINKLKNAVEPVIVKRGHLTETASEPFAKLADAFHEKAAEPVAELVLEDKKNVTAEMLDPPVEDKKREAENLLDLNVAHTKNISVLGTEPVVTLNAEPIVEIKKKVAEIVTETTAVDTKKVAERATEPAGEENEITTARMTTLDAVAKDEITETVVSDEITDTIIKSESTSVDSDFEDNISLAAICRSYSEESKTRKDSKSAKVCTKPKTKQTKDKNTMQGKVEIHRALEDPEFLKYLELRQDALMDENPHVTDDEAVHYLFQTWVYSENLKSDTVKSFDKEQVNLVKGLCDEPPPQPKKIRKKPKVEKDKDIEQEPQSSDDTTKDRSKRKIVRAYYNENDTDFEDEMQAFAIFKTENQPEAPKPESTLAPNTEAALETVKKEIEPHESEVLVDEVETFFLQLAKPKPNVFKGIPRERLCEICEKPGSLLKCKGPCSGMYHLDCVRRQTEEPKTPKTPNGPSRGRKKKKPRGRKPRSLDDSGSQSDDRRDLSEETDEIQLDDNLVIDADSFEAQLEVRMQEMLKTELPDDYDYSSEDELNWNDTTTGKCEIVDVKLKLRRPENDYGDFRCNYCLNNEIPLCFVCKSTTSPKNSTKVRQRCQTAHCHKYYHLECLDIWPQTQFNGGEPSRNNKKISESFEAMTCPRHVCHTCVCDDPRGCNTRFSGDKLARCIRCPATYHSFNKCLPAGSTVLSASYIICPRHYEHRPGKVPCHVNTGWCFICALGGTLICCEYCPTSFHAECLNIKPPEGNYMCEDCETGRLPLYGEMVWVKLGHYRWWPGLILHPCEVPENIMSVRHSRGEFVVRFFGQYDHYWVNRGRVFPFQEGDSGKVSSQKSKIDEAFTMAMTHAKRAYEILKHAPPNEEEDIDIASSLLPPHYVKLKVNKPCGALVNYKPDDEENSLTLCECDPNDIEPCGPDTHCLNRMLLTECGPTCRAGDRCCNRAFENRLYPKMTPYRTSWGGWGLKTLVPIRQGQFVIEYVGELLDEAEFRRRMQRKHEIRDENYYFLTLDRERMIDAGPKGNLARFMNHCCEPNCETQKWTVLGDVRVGLFALRDIPANSEVTFNYNLECAGIEKKPCLCGAKRCSGYIGAKPKQDEPQPKKNKRPYKKRKPAEVSPLANKPKMVKPRMTKRSRPKEPKELTEIEKDLLIIKNATNGLSSDSESSGRLNGLESEILKQDVKPLKRKREGSLKDVLCNGDVKYSPSVKKIKLESDALRAVGD